MKKLLYLIIAGALIFSCVDDIFATNYKQMGKVYPQGNFSSDCFTKIYETTLLANATSVTISNLAGNTTVEYRLNTKVVNGYDGSCYAGLTINNDTGANYGIQHLRAINTTVTASRYADAFLYVGAASALGSTSLSETLIHAKSGYVRTGIQGRISHIVTTTVGQLYLVGQSWNNTTDEVTSLVISADQASGLGIGTYICLWGKEYKQ